MTVTTAPPPHLLSAEDVFADGGGRIAVHDPECLTVVVRGHLSPPEVREVLAEDPEWWPALLRPEEKHLRHLWMLFARHDEDCDESGPDTDDCDCGLSEIDWFPLYVDRLTRGAVPVTWIVGAPLAEED